MSQFELIDETGASRFRGTQRPPGGGSQPVEVVTQNTAGVAPSTPTSLEWGHVEGDALLDYSDPATPTVVEGGRYLITCAVALGTSVAGGWFLAQLGQLSSLVTAQSVDQLCYVPPNWAAECSVSLVVPLAAGDGLYLSVYSGIAETTTGFLLAYVCKLS